MIMLVSVGLLAGEVVAPPVVPIPLVPLIQDAPKGSVAYSGRTKVGSEKMALSPDGTRIAAAGSRGAIQIYETAGLKFFKEFETGAVTSLDFAADGKGLLTSGPGNDVVLWDLETEKAARTFTGHTVDVRAVACSADGSRVASTDSAGTLKIWNFNDAKVLFTLTGKKYPDDPPSETLTIEGLAFSPDGRYIVTEATDVKARVWDAVRGVEVRMLPDHDGSSASVSISPSGTLVASSRGGGLLRVWKIDTANVSRVMNGHEADVVCSVFAADECTVFSGGGDMVIRQWDLDTGIELRRFTLMAPPTALAMQADGRRLYSLSADAGITAWDPAGLPLTSGKYAGIINSNEGAWLAMASVEYDARSEAIAFYVNGKDPVAVVKFLSEKLSTGGIKEEERKAQMELIAQLDDAAYATRLKASEELKKLGIGARESLTQALKNASSEVRMKAAELLRDMGGTVDARGVLAIEIFGLLRTPAAVETLKQIAAQDGPNAGRAKAMLASLAAKK